MNLKDTRPFCKVGDKLEFEVVSITDLFGTIHYSMQSNDINVLFKNSNPNQENWKPKMVEATQWIPVSERLPEDGQTVLIQYVDRKDKEDITMAVGWMNVVLYSWDDRIVGNPDAVAWMPLPPAFVEGDKE